MSQEQHHYLQDSNTTNTNMGVVSPASRAAPAGSDQAYGFNSSFLFFRDSGQFEQGLLVPQPNCGSSSCGQP